MKTVVTFLWKDVQDFDKYQHPSIENKKLFKERSEVYNISYVNKLFSSIRRNTTHPVECVLITDYENTDTNADRVIPMWDDYREYGRCYCRLKLFDKSMQEIIANRFTWIDIDVIIKDNIDWLFEFDDDFIIKGQPIRFSQEWCNGSMGQMNAGSRQIVWDKFRENLDFYLYDLPRDYKNYTGSDQAVISHVLDREKIFPLDKYFEYKYKDLFPRDEMDNASMIFFSGDTDPSYCNEDFLKKHWHEN